MFQSISGRDKSHAQPSLGGWWVIQTDDCLLLFLSISSTWFDWASLVAICLPLNSFTSSSMWFCHVLAVAVEWVWLHCRRTWPNTEQSWHLYMAQYWAVLTSVHGPILNSPDTVHGPILNSPDICTWPNTEQSWHLYNHSHKQLSLSDEYQAVKQFLQLKTQSLHAVQISVLFSILGCVRPQCKCRTCYPEWPV